MIKPYNPIMMQKNDAARVGVSHGDTIEIESPGGRVVGLAMVGEAVMEGSLGIEHGYGHHDLGFADPTRDIPAAWLENVSGASVRQGLPVRVRHKA